MEIGSHSVAYYRVVTWNLLMRSACPSSNVGIMCATTLSFWSRTFPLLCVGVVGKHCITQPHPCPLSLFLKDLIYVNECFACMYMYHLSALCPWKSEEGGWSPGTRVTDDYELPCEFWNWPEFLWESSKCSLTADHLQPFTSYFMRRLLLRYLFQPSFKQFLGKLP